MVDVPNIHAFSFLKKELTGELLVNYIMKRGIIKSRGATSGTSLAPATTGLPQELGAVPNATHPHKITTKMKEKMPVQRGATTTNAEGYRG